MKKKIIIPAFALLIGAALAGSVTGTAAWYQYSTKVNGAFIGASGGASGNLNMRIRKEGYGWTTFLAKETIRSYLTSESCGTNIQPITPAVDENGLGKDAALPVNAQSAPDFCLNPVPGKGPYSTWKRATKANYVVIPLQLRYVKQGASELEYKAEKVYLSDLVLEQRTTGGTTSDISDALRFHISNGTTSHLISKNGGTTVTKGQLDLDGDGSPDSARASDKYGFNDSSAPAATPIEYGDGNQISYAKADMIAASRDGLNGDDLVDDSATDAKLIGTTVANSSSFLNVDITIWVEGWQQFSSSAIWADSFIGSDFNIGFEFAVNAEVDA